MLVVLVARFPGLFAFLQRTEFHIFVEKMFSGDGVSCLDMVNKI